MGKKNVEYTITLKDKFTKPIKGASKSVDKMGKSMGNLTSIMKKFAPLAASIGGAAIFTKAIKTGIVFEKEMSNVKALTNATYEEFKRMQSQAEELGVKTQFSAKQAAEGMSFLAMAGFSTENIMKSLPGVLDLAAAGSIDLGRAADIASNVLTQFGIKAENLGRVNDIIAKTATSSNTSIEQMAEALKFTGTTSKVVGQSLEETSAAIGLLGNAGLQGSIGGTSLNFAILEMARSSSPTAKKLKDLGVQVRDTGGKFVGITNVLKQFEDRNISAEKALDIFGARGGRAFGALLQAGSSQLSDFTASLKASEGAAKRMAEIKLDNLAGDLTKLKSATQGFAITMSKKASPALRKMAKGVTKLFQSLDKIAKVKASEEIRKERFEYNSLINVLQKANTNEATRSRVIDTLNTKYSTYLGKLVTEKTTQAELNELRKKGNEEFIKNIRIQARRELIAEEEAKTAKVLQKIIKEEIKLGALNERLKTARKGQAVGAFGGVQAGGYESTAKAIDMVEARIAKLSAKAEKGSESVRKLLDGGIGDAIGGTSASLNLKTTLDKKGQDLQKETKITSRSPKVINISINKLIETQEITTETLTEGKPAIKRMITETILEALNDTQLAYKAG